MSSEPIRQLTDGERDALEADIEIAEGEFRVVDGSPSANTPGTEPIRVRPVDAGTRRGPDGVESTSQDELDALRTENKELRDRLADAETREARLMYAGGQLLSQKEALEKTTSDQKAQIDYLNARNTQLTGENQQLSVELQSARGETQRVKGDLQAETQRKKQVLGEVKRLRDEKKALEDASNAAAARHRAEVQAKDAEIIRLQGDLATERQAARNRPPSQAEIDKRAHEKERELVLGVLGYATVAELINSGYFDQREILVFNTMQGNADQREAAVIQATLEKMKGQNERFKAVQQEQRVIVEETLSEAYSIYKVKGNTPREQYLALAKKLKVQVDPANIDRSLPDMMRRLLLKDLDTAPVQQKKGMRKMRKALSAIILTGLTITGVFFVSQPSNNKSVNTIKPVATAAPDRQDDTPRTPDTTDLLNGGKQTPPPGQSGSVVTDTEGISGTMVIEDIPLTQIENIAAESGVDSIGRTNEVDGSGNIKYRITLNDGTTVEAIKNERVKIGKNVFIIGENDKGETIVYAFPSLNTFD